MDESTRHQWKWKFYRVALHLNAVILAIAMTVVAFFLVPAPYRLPTVVILVILDVLLGITFYKNYHATKAWLDEHVKTKEDT